MDPAAGTQMVLCCAGSGYGPEPTLHGTSQSWSLTSHPAPAQETPLGTSQAVQWLRLHASNAGGMGLIPGQGTKIPHAMRCAPCPPPKKAKRIHWHLKLSLSQPALTPTFLATLLPPPGSPQLPSGEVFLPCLL